MDETIIEKTKEGNNWFITLIFICCLIVIGSSFYFFYFQKNFDFIVEVPCDQNTEECFIRDCSYFECPPNDLSVFKRYVVQADDFKLCPNENCEELCVGEIIECELLACEPAPEFGESCVSPIEEINNSDLLNE